MIYWKKINGRELHLHAVYGQQKAFVRIEIIKFYKKWETKPSLISELSTIDFVKSSNFKKECDHRHIR